MSRFLITSDIHLDANPKHAYRWDTLKWLSRQAKRREVDGLFIAGDLTDRKNDHPAAVIVPLMNWVQEQQRRSYEFLILKGNHDYEDPDLPYLSFLKETMIVHPTRKKWGEEVMFLPHTRHPKEDWEKLDLDADLVIMHQCAKGAKASNGYEMEGFHLPWFLGERVKRGMVISGDIHVPQRLRKRFLYCGSPHPVRFGDHYEPRVILWDDGKLKSIKVPTLRRVAARVTLDELKAFRDDSGVRVGDHLNLAIQMRRSETHLWPEVRAEIREWAEEEEIELWGPVLKLKEGRKRAVRRRGLGADPMEILNAWGKRTRLDDDYMELGREILQSV